VGRQKNSEGGAPFADYREERRRYGFGGWRNWIPPVEVVIVRAEEIEKRREPVPLEQAIQQAEQRLTEQLAWILGPSDRLVGPVTAEVLEQTAEYAGIRVSAEALEEITAPQPGDPVPIPQTAAGHESP